MGPPTEPPEGDWWNIAVNRRESIWLGLAGLWGLIMFGWMTVWTRIGDQNPTGETLRLSTDDFEEKFEDYREAATETEDGLVPADSSVFALARQFSWDGFPVVLETDTQYEFHLSSADVQHGFSIRPEDVLSQQFNLQIVPGYEFIIPMSFEEPGTYHVLCNEFCGHGHRAMHGTIIVEEGE